MKIIVVVAHSHHRGLEYHWNHLQLKGYRQLFTSVDTLYPRVVQDGLNVLIETSLVDGICIISPHEWIADMIRLKVHRGELLPEEVEFHCIDGDGQIADVFHVDEDGRWPVYPEEWYGLHHELLMGLLNFDHKKDRNRSVK